MGELSHYIGQKRIVTNKWIRPHTKSVHECVKVDGTRTITKDSDTTTLIRIWVTAFEPNQLMWFAEDDWNKLPLADA